MAREIKELVTETVERSGYEVVQLKNHPPHVVRLWIDRDPDGVTLQDCIAFTRTLREAFEVEGLDPGDFQIEVLSPGLDRLLARQKDFDRFRGSDVTVRLGAKRVEDGRKNFKGKLLGLVDGDLRVQGPEESTPWVFRRRDVSEVRLVPDVVDKGKAQPKPGERTRKPRKAQRKGPKQR